MKFKLQIFFGKIFVGEKNTQHYISDTIIKSIELHEIERKM